MKYEDANIFTFNSYKPKREPVSVNSEMEAGMEDGMEENAGLKESPDELRKESPDELSPENRNMGEIAMGEIAMGEIAMDEIANSLDLEGASELVTSLLCP